MRTGTVVMFAAIGASTIAVFASAQAGQLWRYPEDWQPDDKLSFAISDPRVANNDDTISVRPGTPEQPWILSDTLDFQGKNILVACRESFTADPKALDNPDPTLTVIDAGPFNDRNYPVVRFVNGEGPTAEIRGFTLKNGRNPYGGGVQVITSSPTVAKNIITDNRALVNGGGIYVYNGAPTIAENTIENNLARRDPFLPRPGEPEQYGGGVAVFGLEVGTTLVTMIDGNTIRDNRSWDGGGGVYGYRASLTMQDNLVETNQALRDGADGGGFSYLGGVGWPTVELVGNFFTGNRAFGDGGGARFYDGAEECVEHNVFHADSADKNGGGLYMGDVVETYSIKDVRENLLCECVANADQEQPGEGGGGMFFKSYTLQAQVNRNTIIGNRVLPHPAPSEGDLTLGGGVAIVWYADAQLDSNKIYDNDARWGGGIGCQGPDVRAGLRWNTINGNGQRENSGTDTAGAIAYTSTLAHPEHPTTWAVQSSVRRNKIVGNGTALPEGSIGGLYIDQRPVPPNGSLNYWILVGNYYNQQTPDSVNEIFDNEQFWIYNDDPGYTVPARYNWWGNETPIPHLYGNVVHVPQSPVVPHPALLLFNPAGGVALLGESGGGTVKVYNTTASPQTFDLWVKITRPDRQTVVYSLLEEEVTVLGGTQWTSTEAIEEPTTVPGLNLCEVMIGDYDHQNPQNSVVDDWDFSHYWVR